MFERFTERSRRVVFFGRYEASVLCSNTIETEHLLLRLFREDRQLRNSLPSEAVDRVRQELKNRVPDSAKPVSTSVDLPLSRDSKTLLALAAEESRALEHDLIDSGHLVLGALRLEKSTAATILKRYGIDYAEYRKFVQSSFHKTLPDADPIKREKRRELGRSALSAAPASSAPCAAP